MICISLKGGLVEIFRLYMKLKVQTTILYKINQTLKILKNIFEIILFFCKLPQMYLNLSDKHME